MKERERPHIVRERVKCGKASCRCARDPTRRHGPYTYFRWERWETASGRVAYYREYVPRSELVRVRRWIRRYRGDAAQNRSFLWQQQNTGALVYRTLSRVRSLLRRSSEPLFPYRVETPL